jgi:hypothetical protein
VNWFPAGNNRLVPLPGTDNHQQPILLITVTTDGGQAARRWSMGVRLSSRRARASRHGRAQHICPVVRTHPCFYPSYPTTPPLKMGARGTETRQRVFYGAYPVWFYRVQTHGISAVIRCRLRVRLKTYHPSLSRMWTMGLDLGKSCGQNPPFSS